MGRRTIFEGGGVRPHLRSRRRRGRWFHTYRREGREIGLGVHGLPPDDPRVLAAYAAEHARWEQFRREEARPGPGSLAALIDAFEASPEFAAYAPLTRKHRAAIHRRYRAAYGAGEAAAVAPVDIEEELAGRSPWVALDELKALRALFRWAVKRRLLPRDPSAGVTLRRPKTVGFETMGAAEIARFQARWAKGTRERLIFDLAILTGAARVDLRLLSAANLRGRVLAYRRSKTGVEAFVPVTRELRAVIDAAPAIPAFILTAHGRPFSAAGLGNAFAEAARAAGVSARLHGLRKAFCVYWAEQGKSTHEIAAMAGHISLAEVERYTKAADRAAMIARLAEG